MRETRKNISKQESNSELCTDATGRTRRTAEMEERPRVGVRRKGMRSDSEETSDRSVLLLRKPQQRDWTWRGNLAVPHAQKTAPQISRL